MFGKSMRNAQRPPESGQTAVVRTNHFGQFLVLTATCFFSLSLSFLLVIIGEHWLNFSIIVEPEYFEVSQDELDRRFEEVPAEVKEMSNRLGLTAEAKRILYRYQPEIFQSVQDPDYLCAYDVDLNDNLNISGCFATEEERILLLNTPSIESTLIHEFLHAAYQENYHLDREQLTNINRLLEEVYSENEDRLEKIISLYEDLHTHNHSEFNSLNRYNELHSWIGIIIADIPEELEEHYAQYFKDRQVIIDAYHRHRDEL